MKVSFHRGKGSANHNDRNFDVAKAKNIRIDDTVKNLYFDFTMGQGGVTRDLSFKESEKRYYEATFRTALDALNRRYIKQGHPERVKDMSDWEQTDEEIIQLGNKADQIDAEKLKQALQAYLQELTAKYPNYRPLNFAIHLDEATPHVHLRSVIVAHDKDGNLKPAKTKGLREMGVERPEPDRPEGRHNNPLMTFTASSREILYRKVEELGLEIDREVRPENQHLDVIEYKRRQEAMKLREIEAQKATLEDEYEEKMDALEEKYEGYRSRLNGALNDLRAEVKAAEGLTVDVLRAENRKLRAENDNLKADIRVRDEVIKAHGLWGEVVELAKSLGHHLVQKMSGPRMRM